MRLAVKQGLDATLTCEDHDTLLDLSVGGQHLLLEPNSTLSVNNCTIAQLPFWVFVHASDAVSGDDMQRGSTFRVSQSTFQIPCKVRDVPGVEQQSPINSALARTLWMTSIWRVCLMTATSPFADVRRRRAAANTRGDPSR
jgi:hypothetical protein